MGLSNTHVSAAYAYFLYFPALHIRLLIISFQIQKITVYTELLRMCALFHTSTLFNKNKIIEHNALDTFLRVIEIKKNAGQQKKE